MGVCMCTNKIDEGKIYLEFMDTLTINTTKSEDLIKKLKEKYVTVLKEDKKKSALLKEIFPMIDSSVIEYREHSHSYFNEYFDTNKRKFYALCLFCEKESNYKKSFEEITIFNRKEFGHNYSTDKNFINREFLEGIICEYLKFSTVDTITFIAILTGSKTTEKYFTDLFDEETRNTICKDLFHPLKKIENVFNFSLK